VVEGINAGCSDVPEGPVELRRIRQRLAGATAGDGGVVYLEGTPRAGKTELLMATADAARAAGMRVLNATGHPLEREFPFGVAVQLFEGAWFGVGPRERAMLLDGPARSVGELMSGTLPLEPLLAGTGAFALIRGLFSMAGALVSEGASRPLTLIVDDLDCADELSLRFLAYLAARIGKLPVAAVLAARPAQPSVDSQALTALRSASHLLVLAPAGPRLRAVPNAAPILSRLGPVEPPSAGGPRAVAAQMALRKSLADGHRESVIDLAELAWGDGALLESDEAADAWPAVAGSLLFVDELERSVEVAQAATGSGSTAGTLGAARWQGWSLYHQGQITAALAVAEAARAIHRRDRAACGLIAACRLAQGRLDDAEAALRMVPDAEGIEEIDASVLLDLRAQLRLAQLRPADALADALEAGRLSRVPWGVIGPGVVAWRSTAALARMALGETQRARALAEEELGLARERGLRRVVIRDLRILAFSVAGTRRLDLFAEAVRVGRAGPARLEYMNALVDLGAATRRANQRTAARDPLRKGLELADGGGAAALARRAREELDATGARSRRVMLSGINALTPSERRVADLAAGGLTTRQIARVLFVTPKTVEFHLRHVYRKLDIPSSRADLARAMLRAGSG
jgi:DNA-binding CsgD family transcriptional regulator